MIKLIRGFTLIELMIVISIIAILTAIAIPSYSTYVMKAKFSEVVLATMPVKMAAEIALQSGSVQNINQLNGGAFGIPNDISNSTTHKAQYLESLITENGKITAKGTAKVGGNTFVLEVGSELKTPVLWKTSGTCVDAGLC